MNGLNQKQSSGLGIITTCRQLLLIIIIILYTTFRNHGKKVACYFILRAELMGALKDVLLTMNKKFNYSLRGIVTMCVEYE